MKNFKKVLALVLAVVMLLSVATIASAITSEDYKDAADIAKNEQTEAVDVLSYIGVLNGYGDGAFKPNQDITRAEAAKIIAMFDNGATDINDLFTSANPFTDCKGNWAESYIAYGFKAGIIGGVGNNKFAPSAKVTGIQYLKMVLVVLGYDAKEEGLEGASWAVNTLALAKKIGLLNDLDTLDVSANLLRGQAAQIMLNALKAYTVEYGQEFKYNVTTTTGSKYNYITTAGAVSTGKKLMKEWNLSIAYDYDVWGVPNHSWVKGTTTFVTYDDAPVLTYTNEVKFCDILVDLGVAKTSAAKKTVDYVAENGALLYGTTVATIEAEKTNPGTNTDATLKHTTGDVCLNATGAGKTIGGTGALTRVYSLDAGYAIVVIDTYFAQVQKVYAAAHQDDAKLKVTVWTAGLVADNGTNDKNGSETVTTYNFSGDYAKGDYALVYRLGAAAAGSEKTAFGGTPNDIYVKAKSTAAATDVLKSYKTAVSTTIGDTTYPDNRNFDLGYQGTIKTTYNVYTDFYGNVIALIKPATVYSYGVIDQIRWEHGSLANKIDAHAEANLVFMDATTAGAALMAAIDDTAFANADTNATTGTGIPLYTAATVSSNSAANEDQYQHKLYEYNVTSDGYVITDEGEEIIAGTTSITKGVPTKAATGIYTNDNTIYLVESSDGTFKTYTGYKNVPTMTGITAEYFDDGSYVTYMYVNATGAETGFTTELYYIYNNASNGNNGTYETFPMYKAAEACDTMPAKAGAMANKTTGVYGFAGAGLYEVTTNDNGVITTIKQVVAAADGATYKLVANVTACDGNTLENAADASVGVNVTKAFADETRAVYMISGGAVSAVTATTDDDFLLTDASPAVPKYNAICVMDGTEATAVYFYAAD